MKSVVMSSSVYMLSRENGQFQGFIFKMSCVPEYIPISSVFLFLIGICAATNLHYSSGGFHMPIVALLTSTLPLVVLSILSCALPNAAAPTDLSADLS